MQGAGRRYRFAQSRFNMARTPSPEIQATPLRPVASPVESYVRPAEPSRSSLHDVAQGLAAFDTGLQTWLQKREQEQSKADAARGEAAFNRNNQVGWAEAVASGTVPASASPIFVESYKTAQGSHMGVRLREQFNTQYATWGAATATTPRRSRRSSPTSSPTTLRPTTPTSSLGSTPT